MSDLHSLPLLGHDMPEIQTPHFARAKVTKGPQGWTWWHQCTPKTMSFSVMPFIKHDTAFALAVSHMRICG